MYYLVLGGGLPNDLVHFTTAIAKKQKFNKKVT
jgi:hypothetical protein